MLESITPKNRSEQEIAGYRDALNLIHESAKYMPFSTNLILQLHNMLYKYMGKRGEHWKITDNQIAQLKKLDSRQPLLLEQLRL